MFLLIIRHAIAEDREEFAESEKDDSERPLTKLGRRRMRRNARGLRRVAPVIDVVASSPYVRAFDTARIVADTLGVPDDIVSLELLTPDQPPAALLPWLLTQPAGATVAIVGHEPHLGRTVSWLMADLGESRVVFKKGGACLLDLGVLPAAGSAMLHWHLTPAQMRAMAD